MDVLLDVCNLTKQYNRKAKPAIDQISFQVRRGEFHAFVGANGAGKTTTIKSIVGAYASFDGKIKIGGVNNKSKYSKIKLGYIPELARFPSRISAYNYLVDMAMLNRLTKEEAVKFVDDILKTFNMENLKKVSPNKFSSGQKKKILLAQALSNNPDLLIMDEPTANLDPKSRIEFFDILKKLQLQGKSIFISSHILSELDIYADAITILDGGKIAFSGKRELALEDKKDTYRIVLKEEGDFGKANLSNLNIVQDLENKKEYLVSSSNQELLNNFIFNLFKEKKLVKSEEYKLSIEEMYKKYVIKGSVHTSN
ncbi:ABC transporter ATP-binding protein [Malacoplasma penetrans]|nr:ABC transporter ATP-binding protein [Malacoplasma penetrans]